MSPFVGRVAELALLRGVLADAAARHPHVVQIEGPAGVGKTALIERFLADPVAWSTRHGGRAKLSVRI